MKYPLFISIGLLACAANIAPVAGAASPPGATAAKAGQATKPVSVKPGAGTQQYNPKELGVDKVRGAPGRPGVAVGDVNGDGRVDATDALRKTPGK